MLNKRRSIRSEVQFNNALRDTNLVAHDSKTDKISTYMVNSWSIIEKNRKTSTKSKQREAKPSTVTKPITRSNSGLTTVYSSITSSKPTVISPLSYSNIEQSSSIVQNRSTAGPLKLRKLPNDHNRRSKRNKPIRKYVESDEEEEVEEENENKENINSITTNTTKNKEFHINYNDSNTPKYLGKFINIKIDNKLRRQCKYCPKRYNDLKGFNRHYERNHL
ncbi:hypothetical protein KGF54_003722 [Candida jiufengensis]|uniref:uncharacterized protein n=1 Tax=Candida jiufengensis TaxID=497108 RepID=UPI0022254C30|nr:uncharacterized protein KGF54_003722 [Candida jiufengensis]KAI5952855.1 hypothetical protein KGF54_003722 [Candida jiufengensis]